MKHFKWLQRGKRRLHDKPRAGEIRACRPWLTAEIEAVAPKAIVCLGTTAVQAVLGRAESITSLRHKTITLESGAACFVTVHPSSILRTPPDARQAALEAFIADLKRVAKILRLRFNG